MFITGLENPQALAQPGIIEEALISAGDFGLLRDAKAAAAKLEMTQADFATLSVRRFFERADDADWTHLVSQLNRADDPVASVVTIILRRAVRDVEAMEDGSR